MAEEGQHARWLGVLRKRFGGERLTSHWSDGAFVVLRHMGGLRREICVLLTAEVIALTYYRVLAQAYDDPVLAAACERILLDERGHVAFHRATLSVEFASMAARRAHRGRAGLARLRRRHREGGGLDHRAVLSLAGVSRREFEAEVRGRAARLARAVRQGPAGAAGVDLSLVSLDSPDETRTFEKGRFELFRVGPMTIGRATYEPGWKWSEHVGAETGESLCQVEHVGLVVSGRAVAAMADGTERTMEPDQFFYVPRPRQLGRGRRAVRVAALHGQRRLRHLTPAAGFAPSAPGNLPGSEG